IGVAIGAGIEVGEFALPDVHAVIRLAVFTLRNEIVAPGKYLSFEAATGGVFPLRFGGEASAGEAAEGFRIVPRDVDDRELVAFFEVAAGAFGAVPASAI